MRSNELGDQKVDVAVALTVAVRRHVHGQAIHAGGEIRAVVEIEAAQEILVRLTVAAVLGDDEARHHFEHFARTQGRAILELRGEHGADACGVRLRERFHALRRDGDFFDELAGLSRGPAGEREKYAEAQRAG